MPPAEFEPAIPAVERLQTAKNTDLIESGTTDRHVLYAAVFTAVKTPSFSVYNQKH
jgi:hypothetical protein